MSTRERRRARGWALQILYAWDARGRTVSPLQIMSEFLADRRVAAESRVYIRDLIAAITDDCDEIDARIQECLTNWRFQRLSAIDRNIMRIAAAEMLHLPDVPPVVSIREAILLAEKYGTKESPRFVNGVLDGLMKRLGAGDGPGAGIAGGGR